MLLNMLEDIPLELPFQMKELKMLKMIKWLLNIKITKIILKLKKWPFLVKNLLGDSCFMYFPIILLKLNIMDYYQIEIKRIILDYVD